jgi:DNA segregation ATPase FtsK/SpoIIIE-like protein
LVVPTLKQLQNRVNELERQLAGYQQESAYMDALYSAAVTLITSHQRSSVIFLQRHLLIDHFRATQLRNRLIENGLINS